MKLKKKRRDWWIWLLIAAVLASAGYWGYGEYFQEEEVVEASTVQTSKVRTGDLVLYASGAGTIVAAEEYNLSFSTTGLLVELNVSVGDKVSEGDVLARLGDLEELEAQITSYELQVLTAQRDLDELFENLDSKRAQAQLDIIEAEIALEDAKDTRLQMDYSRCNQETIDMYYTELDNATQYVSELVNREVTGNLLTEAINTKTTAQANYYYCTMERTESEVMEAEALLSLAEIAIAEAQETYDTLLEGPDPYEVQLAEAELANDQAQLDAAEEDLENAVMRAPIDSTVMSVEAKAGELVGTSTIVTLADLDHPVLEVLMDETDLANVAIGYEVEVIFDAFPDDVFTGEVVQVDPELVSVGNSIALRALVELDEESFNKPQSLPVGLNASVDVIGGRAEDAVLVPVEALREIAPNEYAVFVMVNGEPELRMVQVGLMDYTYAEILSGLEAGETVTTGIVEAD